MRIRDGSRTALKPNGLSMKSRLESLVLISFIYPTIFLTLAFFSVLQVFDRCLMYRLHIKKGKQLKTENSIMTGSRVTQKHSVGHITECTGRWAGRLLSVAWYRMQGESRGCWSRRSVPPSRWKSLAMEHLCLRQSALLTSESICPGAGRKEPPRGARTIKKQGEILCERQDLGLLPFAHQQPKNQNVLSMKHSTISVE